MAGITYARLRALRGTVSWKERRGRGCPWPETVYASARASLGPSSASGGSAWKHVNLPCTVKGLTRVEEVKILRKKEKVQESEKV